MDPNLFAVDWNRLTEMLAAVVVLSFIIERALAPGSHLTQEDRDRLKDLNAGNGTTVGEGDFVQLVGFLAEERNIRPAGPESVNCRLKGGLANNDVHLPLVQRESETEYDSVVVEPIPQNRPAAWTIALFKRLQSERRLIMVRGNLFFDNQHRVRDDPEEEEGLGSEPKRFSLWEIHPVTQLFECTLASNNCDPASSGQWREIR